MAIASSGPVPLAILLGELFTCDPQVLLGRTECQFPVMSVPGSYSVTHEASRRDTGLISCSADQKPTVLGSRVLRSILRSPSTTRDSGAGRSWGWK